MKGCSFYAKNTFYLIRGDNLLPPITVGEFVECVRKYVDGVSHNLRSLSPY